MTQPLAPPLAGFSRAGDYSACRDVLVAAGYDTAQLRAQLGVEGIESLPRAQLSDLARRLVGHGPAQTLMRLFWLGEAVAADVVARALRPMSVEAWVDAGLLGLHPDGYRANVKLQPYRGLLIASDPPHHEVVDPPQDWVMGVGRTTAALLRIVLPCATGRTLEVGTGSGVVALLHSRAAPQVVTLDINPRATAYARFNAALNGITNVSCRTGDVFADLGEQRFDFILSNPPFVVAPEARYTYRSVRNATSLCRDLMTTLSARLEPGGHCQLTCDWPHADPEAWAAGVTRWAEQLGGLDVWVQQQRTWAASEYARHWIRITEATDDREVESRLASWMRFYADEHIHWITSGTLTLRRRSDARSRVQLERPHGDRGLRDGAGILQGLARMDELA